MKYQADRLLLFGNQDHLPVIDGLRAVAIIPVVAFHVGVPLFGGGFVGVDIFFVISGFLITRLLFRELAQTGRIDILNFYARRVRRLLPALALVLLATMAAAQAFLTIAGEQQQLSLQTIATAVFSSNFYFWRTQTGYFAGPSDQLPLLHMWTLAVEEQFYIVWPLVMIAIALLSRRYRHYSMILITLIAASLLSFAACWAVTVIRPTVAFYLMPFRAWEFGIGAILSLLPGWVGQSRLPNFCSFAGIAAIAASVVGFDAHTQFPGPAAALPVLGAAGIILGSLSSNPVSSALNTSPMITIGKWSYSWYLWHWPLLAIGRSASLGQHNIARDILLAFVALGLSAATYRWIEEPVRQRRPWPFSGRSVTVVAGAALLIFLVAVAGTTRIIADARAGKDPLIRAAIAAQSDVADIPGECTHFKLPFDGLAPAEHCTIGPKDQPLIVLWGDSHAHHFIPTVADYATERHLRLLPRIMGACPPAAFREGDLPDSPAAASCVHFNQSVIGELAALKASGATTVILASRWFATELWRPSEAEAYRVIARTISDIMSAKLQIAILASVPGYPYSVPQCLVRHGPEKCDRQRIDVDTERAPMMRVLSKISADFPGVKLWDPIDHFCDGTRCRTMKDDMVLYRDEHHIAASAARAMSASVSSVLP